MGIMHCFGGTLDQARSYVDVGFLISIACPITYPANEESRRIASGLPLEAIVVETDSPYLPPQKLRGRRNEPSYVLRVIEAVADAVLYMASLPLSANVQFMTVMATQMPFVGRG